MGTWGTGLYQDDVTCDIKEEYLNRLKVGYTNIDATSDLIDCYMDSIEDEEEGPLFWFALADVQWRYGRLLPEVKKVALEYLKEGRDLERWKDNEKQYEKRKFILQELEKKLNSPMPTEKKLKKLFINKPIWEIGDVLIYQIHNGELTRNEMVKESKWYNKFVALRVIGITKYNKGSLPREYSDEFCVVGIYNWVGDSVPDIEKINKFELIEINKKPIMRILPSSKNELKQLDIKNVLKDPDYNTESVFVNDKTLGIIWLNNNNIDCDFIQILKETEYVGFLIDETK